MLYAIYNGKAIYMHFIWQNMENIFSEKHVSINNLDGMDMQIYI